MNKLRIIAVVSASASSLTFCWTAFAQATPVGKVALLIGSGKLKRAQTSYPLSTNLEVFENDEIELSEKSATKILFRNSNTSFLAPLHRSGHHVQ